MEDNFYIPLNVDNINHISNPESSFNSLLTNFKIFLEDSKKESIINLNDNKGNLINAYIRTMSSFIDNSNESTLQGLNIAIKRATLHLFKEIRNKNILPRGRSMLPLRAVGELMINMLNKYISKRLIEDIIIIKNNLVSIANDLYLLSLYSKDKISNFFNWVIKPDMKILVHGFSNTILYSLLKSKQNGINFKVLVTESRPDNSGEIMAKILNDNDIETQIILDIAITSYIKDIDFVIFGADAVCENGGIINNIGTFTISLCSKNFKKPIYVLVESLKFLKLYPLDQYDISQTVTKLKLMDNLNAEYIYSDYTPPEFITLLFTDIGIFTPSAVSDELIQMFYN